MKNVPMSLVARCLTTPKNTAGKNYYDKYDESNFISSLR